MACCCFVCFCNSIKLLVGSTLMVCLFVIELNFHREIKVVHVQLYIIVLKMYSNNYYVRRIIIEYSVYKTITMIYNHFREDGARLLPAPFPILVSRSM